MKVNDLDKDINGRVSFDLRFSGRVPDRAGSYVIANMDGDVLYIGQTVDLRRRMGEHLSNQRMTQRTALGLPSWFYYKYVSGADLLNTESSLLSAHKFARGELPILNRLGP